MDGASVVPHRLRANSLGKSTSGPESLMPAPGQNATPEDSRQARRGHFPSPLAALCLLAFARTAGARGCARRKGRADACAYGGCIVGGPWQFFSIRHALQVCEGHDHENGRHAQGRQHVKNRRLLEIDEQENGQPRSGNPQQCAAASRCLSSSVACKSLTHISPLRKLLARNKLDNLTQKARRERPTPSTCRLPFRVLSKK